MNPSLEIQRLREEVRALTLERDAAREVSTVLKRHNEELVQLLSCRPVQYEAPEMKPSVSESRTPRSRVLQRNWLEVKIPEENDVLIVSDSIMKCVSPDSLRRSASLFAFSGLRVHELKELLEHFKNSVRARVLIMCVGSNDYYRTPISTILKNLEDTVNAAKAMSGRIMLCNVHPSLWKSKRPLGISRTEVQSLRRQLNYGIRQLADANHATAIDLEELFRDHREGQYNWYQADTLHPNAAGVMAIELCLMDMLAGRHFNLPVSINFTRAMVESQRRQAQTNYALTTICGEVKTTSKRPVPVSSDEDSETESPVWKRQK